ncbi:HAD family hydrolase [Sphingomonas rubra]|uniref:Haloacid dehalogenase superfamily, subfamily IA, variant 3 with third motif having DD or ED/haloacid dehalogenase superfamily, subfamily IA, variant 1 with third motif having Dx(3-4)D or Dx(3-4)E n=1 Tax=Sphingomonas rubra TaxID=634430 RepID=A0A1I5RR69_9SPHN|nr:HAD family hydrolase [Sphingomonas rubra]SFP60741.1 haloacid dehalogenase superfamily, subfamily IA, variant 3 with third motif having DD or ED/haloacid dehalogenase superfamily, subfamily IA, variant 1 with third motif having Dx(3-4)D or Dx(3-4)E [Sphingomonas rubra]
MPSSIRAVLFDIDGTLIDSNDLHVQAWAQAFAERGHAVDRDAIAGQIGKGGDNLVPALLPDVPPVEQKGLSKAQGRLFKQVFLDRAKPFPQARALVERVAAAGARVVLASSASQEELDHYVALMGIGDLVAASTSIDDVETSKPAPDIFAVALEKSDFPAAQVIAVGDTPYDVEAAAKAGVATVALLSGGFDRDVLTAAGAVAIYDDVAALLANYEASPLAC